MVGWLFIIGMALETPTRLQYKLNDQNNKTRDTQIIQMGQKVFPFLKE